MPSVVFTVIPENWCGFSGLLVNFIGSSPANKFMILIIYLEK
jgi:hypothetical protein